MQLHKYNLLCYINFYLLKWFRETKCCQFEFLYA